MVSVSLEHANATLFDCFARLQLSLCSSYSPVLSLLDQRAGEGARMRSRRAGQEARRGRELRRARWDAGEMQRGRRRDHRGASRPRLSRRLLRGVPGLRSEAREHGG